MANIPVDNTTTSVNNVLLQIQDVLLDILLEVAKKAPNDAVYFGCSSSTLNRILKNPAVVKVINIASFVKDPTLMNRYPLFFESAINSRNPIALYLRGMSRVIVDFDVLGSLTFFYQASKGGVDAATLMAAICATACGHYPFALEMLDRIDRWRNRMCHMIQIGDDVMDTAKLMVVDDRCKLPQFLTDSPRCHWKHHLICCELCYLYTQYQTARFVFDPSFHSRRGSSNTYFQLNYLDTITFALEDDHIDKLMDSQFGKLFQAGNKIAFSVRFLHYLLSRKLVTSEKKDIWCLFSGQPIRFSMREFAIATGLDCSTLPLTSEGDDDEIKSYTKQLFGSEKNATPLWIANTLLGRPYKDKDTRFKLACLLLVDGIVCPTSKNTKINGDHILMVRDVDEFLSYPWGRKSFDITMESIKTRTATLSNLCQPTCAIQGFLHALQMVVLACVPNLLSKDVKGKKPSLADDDEDDDDLPLIRPGAQKPITHQMNHVKMVDKDDKVVVKHILEDEDSVFDEEIMDDDEEESKVEKLPSAIEHGTAFTNKSFVGGVKASEHSKLPKHPSSSTSQKTSSDGDDHLDSGVPAFLEKLLAGNSSFLNAVNTLSSDFWMIRRDVKSAVNELAALRAEFTKFKKRNCSTDTLPVTTSNKVHREEPQKDNQGTNDGDQEKENEGNAEGEDNAAAQEGENQVYEPKIGHGVDDSQVEDEKEFTFTDEATKATNTIDEVLQDLNSCDLGVDESTNLPVSSIPVTDPNIQETEDIADVQDPIPEPPNTKVTGDHDD
ncbi:hypothetical protein EUTSA_v10029276mg [Eutrema salsugineum]|uniref:DUF1985 domain-containing protein n=1 Tax=Eutrema salsugineum TaxID=72664 RepID=V4L8H3_EUTSA|nr:hypothetical protein EUTSA_v10029276mg [Eutrema salsugineum]